MQDQFINATTLLSKMSDRVLNNCDEWCLSAKQLKEENKEMANVFNILIIDSDIAASSGGIQKIIIDILNTLNTSSKAKKYYRYQLLLSVIKYEQKQRKMKNL
uniref:Uncharacterized protein n=1 Tax=Pithovirus LCPAC401 TaxID=2506595 RepID=A0A481Z9J6_9VIRU|nr:MAG: hypothetical protein LCPAC401_01960 [Pithovirus LCPAC401]